MVKNNIILVFFSAPSPLEECTHVRKATSLLDFYWKRAVFKAKFEMQSLKFVQRGKR